MRPLQRRLPRTATPITGAPGTAAGVTLFDAADARARPDGVGGGVTSVKV
jgi:hypothetical protein